MENEGLDLIPKWIRELRDGDEVTFTDPDPTSEQPVRVIVIRHLTIRGEFVSITGKDGSELEAFPHELN